MNLTFSPQLLYFKHPFKIAHGTRDHTPIVITQLEHEGFIGYGEACMPPYLGETHETVLAFLTQAAKILTSYKSLDIPTIMHRIDALAPGNTAAKAAIDIALHDLKGKMMATPCWKILDADKTKTPYTTFTLGIDTPDKMIQKLKEADPYKILKIKLNGENDRAVIDTIRSYTDKPIAIDVNQGWKVKEQALEMIEWLTNKNVLFIEQPLSKEKWQDAQWLFERSPLPIFADESIQRYTDIDQVKNCFHGINIKLMKCTGMLEAHQLIMRARELQLTILIGCMSETSCAISAAAQLSPFADYADLDGCLLIKDDPFTGIDFIDGKIQLNDLPGIGVSLN